MTGPRRSLLLLLFVGGALIFADSNSSLLYRFDDAFFAATARQVAEEGNWLNLELRGTPVFEKPPLVFWLEALAIRALGPTSAAVRFPGSVLFLGLVLLLFARLRSLRNDREALVAALVLLMTQQILYFARRPVTEIYVVIWSWLAALCYLEVLRGGGVRPRALGGLAFGLAVMTKGIMGLLAAGPILVHVLIERQALVVLRHWGTLIGVLVFAALTVPWHLYMVRSGGAEFVEVYFWTTQLSFLTGTSHSDPWSASVIVRKIAENYWPWLLALVIALMTSARALFREPVPGASEERIDDRRWLRFLWIWIGVILLVFHLTYVKRHRYVLSIYPAFAMMVAWLIARSRGSRWLQRGVVSMAVGMAIFAVVSSQWPLVVDFDHYGDKTGALLWVVDSVDQAPVLVHETGESYCFNCDTIA
ncbi:MAG: ArnT family glycosyltransferase, partial [Pseudomonadales bacterium]